MFKIVHSSGFAERHTEVQSFYTDGFIPYATAKDALLTAQITALERLLVLQPENSQAA